MLVLHPGLQDKMDSVKMDSVPAVLGRRQSYSLGKPAAHHSETQLKLKKTVIHSLS